MSALMALYLYGPLLRDRVVEYPRAFIRQQVLSNDVVEKLVTALEVRR